MSVFAPRYARAFSQVAVANHLDLAAAQQQMSDFAALLSENRNLREVLEDPSIPNEQKLKVLDEIARRSEMMPAVRNFLAVIMSHQRLGDLHDILAEYAEVADLQSGTVEAEITSVHVLHEEDRATLQQQVERMTEGRVRTTYAEDASLLGGVVVKIGSKVYDGSLRAQLEQMRSRLANARPA